MSAIAIKWKVNAITNTIPTIIGKKAFNLTLSPKETLQNPFTPFDYKYSNIFALMV